MDIEKRKNQLAYDLHDAIKAFEKDTGITPSRIDIQINELPAMGEMLDSIYHLGEIDIEIPNPLTKTIRAIKDFKKAVT